MDIHKKLEGQNQGTLELLLLQICSYIRSQPNISLKLSKQKGIIDGSFNFWENFSISKSHSVYMGNHIFLILF